MSKILFIETSATLRHAMTRLLQQHGYEFDVYEEFNAGLEQLIRSGNHYDGVILGWPDENTSSTDELLAILCEAPFDEIPLIILAHEADSAKLG